MTLFTSRARAVPLLLAVALWGCGERVQAGLVNAPSMERKSEPRNQYDTVSNEDEGCASQNGSSVASSAWACPKGTTQARADAGKGP